MPRSSWAGSEQTKCDGSEQCRFRAAGWQMDANARNVLDHATVAEVVISKQVVDGTAPPLYIYADRSTRIGDAIA
jgi:DNA-binding IscR family transcriptional regulator